MWEKGIKGKGIVVASIDTGVNFEHEGLQRQYRGYLSNNEFVVSKLFKMC